MIGQLKSFSINAAELDGALEAGMGFDGSSITGFNAIEESDMIAMPDPATFAVLPWRPEEQGVGRMFCDILTPERTPYEGDPRHILRRALKRAAEMGFDTFNVGPELEYFLFRDASGTEPLDSGGYFDLTTLDAGSDVRRETSIALEALGIHVEYSHHEVGPVPARDRHPLRRRAEDGRRLHDLPDHRQGGRAQVRLARDVHAQAAVRRERLGHAHPPVAVRRRPQRLLRRRRPLLPLERRQGVHRRPAAPRARDLLDLRAVGQLLQAARARLRGAGLRRLVAAQPLGARARAALPPGLRARRRGWSCAARTPRATPTSRSRRCCRPASRASRRATSCPSRWRRTSTTSAPRSAGAWASSSCPETLGDAIELTADSELALRTLGEHTFNRFIEIKRREWEEYRIQVTRWELDRYLPIL